jgi:hypothetical protein
MTLLQLLCLLLLGGIIVLLFNYRSWWLRWRQWRLQQHVMSRSDRKLLRRHVWFYRQLTPQQQHRLQQLVLQFFDDKTWVLTQGVRPKRAQQLAIAAHACVLMLGRPGLLFPNMRSIVLYPSAFAVERAVTDSAGVVHPVQNVHLGESWQHGKLVLSLPDCPTSAHADTEHNLVVHEAAHQLAQQDGNSYGMPTVDTPILNAWRTQMQQAYVQLCESYQCLNHPHIVSSNQHEIKDTPWLDAYACTAPAEFFACASELFIQRPFRFAHAQPELYQLFCQFYHLDPRQWQPQPMA